MHTEYYVDFCFHMSGGICSCRSLLFDLDEHATRHFITVLLMASVQQKRTPRSAFAVVGAAARNPSGSGLCLPGNIFSAFAIFCSYIALVKRGQEAKKRLIPLHSALVRNLKHCAYFEGSVVGVRSPLQTRASPEESTQGGLGVGTYERGGKLGSSILKRKKPGERRGHCHL